MLDQDAEIFNSRWAFIGWHGSTLAYVILFLLAGWREGGDPGFTIVPGTTRNVLYVVRLVLGLGMTAASAHWLMRLTERMRQRAASLMTQPLARHAATAPEAQLR